eukprot:CAMPEP_0172549798 /NCGR_PEP_ID=MMETSP1067-20121228/21792_1 /TAXON_ID=265564 ORGANISM="Thalassiosira punctigera, Strain Tpunct2005C2" /NCGR_SAMPLE_ID=MMETSP1067 /ASSEMBLY_ACC=CAM_ASM_000444 /LENGTH=58 /DNA_ID=CAMNT_0013337219 /DNA_START=7 /DNA_END=179 /DNA_ORIENTATION=-
MRLAPLALLAVLGGVAHAFVPAPVRPTTRRRNGSARHATNSERDGGDVLAEARAAVLG